MGTMYHSYTQVVIHVRRDVSSSHMVDAVYIDGCLVLSSNTRSLLTIIFVLTLVVSYGILCKVELRNLTWDMKSNTVAPAMIVKPNISQYKNNQTTCLIVALSKLNKGITMKAEIKGDKLLLELTIAPHESASGLSNVIASTHGNQVTACQHDGQPVTIGVNAFCRIPGAVRKTPKKV